MKTSDRDDIHDLRVASRRFRAALELFFPFIPNDSKRELRKEVRTLTRKLGGLRNIDEAHLFFTERAHGEITTGNELCTLLSDLRPGELKRIRKVLRDFDPHRLDRMVREMIAVLNEDAIVERNGSSLLAYFSEASIKLYMPVHQLLAGATVPEHRTARHALRIAIKKWRYFFEIVAPILERDYTPYLGLLKEYQSILGRMNDMAEFETLLDDLKLSPDERKNAKTALAAEDVRLLTHFTECLEQKPLVYTFLI